MIKHVLEMPVYREVDVAVVGGGPGGVAAALAAAKNGAKTLLVERYYALGGNMSLGLVHSLHGYRSDSNYSSKKHPTSDWDNPLVAKTPITMGIYNRIYEENGTGFRGHYGDPSLRENVDEEVVIYALDQMMKEASVEVLFNTTAFDVIKEGDAVTGIVIANKSGPQVIKAKVVIDCSADADIATRAGVDFTYGDDTGRAHGISLQMQIGGIDVERFLEYLKNRPEPTPEEKEAILHDKYMLTNGGAKSPDARFSLKKGDTGEHHMEGKRLSWDEQYEAMKNGEFLVLKDCVEAEWFQYLKDHPYPETPYMPNTTTPLPIYPKSPSFNWFGIVRDGRVRFDQAMSGVHECLVDSTNEEAISHALVLCRRINWIYMKFFRERIPGFENAYIIKNATYSGRDSRQIVGEYCVTLEDIGSGRQFEDAIANVWRANNLHLINGQYGFRMWFETKKPFTVPYRSLVPKTVDNLLVGGRSISKHYLVRISSMVPCMQYGEAAGVAAALAVREHIRPRDVDIRELQETLGFTYEFKDYVAGESF